MTESATKSIDKLAEIVRGAGYKALVDDDNRISSGMSGLQIGIYLIGDSLQFYCGINREGMAFANLEFANEFNKKYRFAKMYLDDTSIRLEADYYIDLDAENVHVTLEWAINIFDGLVGYMRRDLSLAEEETSRRLVAQGDLSENI